MLDLNVESRIGHGLRFWFYNTCLVRDLLFIATSAKRCRFHSCWNEWHPLVQHLMLAWIHDVFCFVTMKAQPWNCQNHPNAFSQPFPLSIKHPKGSFQPAKIWENICHPSGFQNIENRSMHKLQSQGSPVSHRGFLRPSATSTVFWCKLRGTMGTWWSNQHHENWICMFYGMYKYV